ncbi:MAG TPA: hypothetical protein VKV80_13935 [Streptosporangiaceae bacterium]|nr:hypothetical protein [Streptosporangiaceae bacterium]
MMATQVPPRAAVAAEADAGRSRRDRPGAAGPGLPAGAMPCASTSRCAGPDGLADAAGRGDGWLAVPEHAVTSVAVSAAAGMVVPRQIIAG